jgi:hypothetical protein
MTDGWTAQMLSRGLKQDTIDSRLSLVRRFAAYTNASSPSSRSD